MKHGGYALAEAVERAYAAGQTDYYLEPMVLEDESGEPVGRIKDGDSVIFCCRRGEREIELTESFTDPNFSHFERPFLSHLQFVIMTMYHDKFKDLPIAFAPEKVVKPLAQVLSEAGKTQFHCAESEKYAHVTFFFNGGENNPFPGEVDVRVPSPKGIPFDQKPQLSLPEVAVKVKDAIDKEYDFIITNFANGDVIGHTSNSDAKLVACEYISKYVSEVSAYAKDKGYVVLVTADHGNIETLRDKKGKPHVAHTTNLVPFIVIDPKGREVKLHDGALGDVSPTILKIFGLDHPAQMTGAPLIENADFSNDKVMLIILDGWGYGTKDDNDAIWLAKTPEWDAMLETYPNAKLRASGMNVGLQDGKPGNSEAGHTNLGAGRVVPQDDVRMDAAISDGSFRTNPVFVGAINRAKESGADLHLLSYLTKKSSHGCIDYPIMLTEMAEGVNNVYLHIIFDGRSTDPGSAPDLLKELDGRLEEIGRGKIVDGLGRGIVLDRDNNWDKIRKSYSEMVYGEGTRYRE